MTTNVASQPMVANRAELCRLKSVRAHWRTLCGVSITLCVLWAPPLEGQRKAKSDPWGESDDTQGFADFEGEDDVLDDDEDSADDTGFEDIETDSDTELETAATENEEPSPFSLHGFHRLVLGAWVERLSDQPLASARNSIELALSFEHDFALGDQSSGRFRAHAAGRLFYDAAYLLHRDLYDEPTLEQYELGHLPREIYVALTLGPFRLATGRQLLAWGQGEVLSVLDRVNPQDLSEPGLTPSDERRLPVALTHADLELERHRFELIATHEVSFGLLPPPLSAMSPLRALLLELPGLEDRTLRYRHEPSESLFLVPAHQLHGRYTFRAPFADLALHGSSMLDPLGVPVLPAPAELSDEDIDVLLYHPRFELVGASIVAPVDAFLLRAELQWSFERPIALRRLDSPLLDLSSTRLNQLDVLLGATFLMSTSTSFGLEAQQSYLPEHPAREHAGLDTFWPIEATQLALRADHALLRERMPLQLVGLLIGLDPINAWVVRTQVGYLFSESFKLQLQFVHYQPTERFGFFYGFETHDRVVVSTQWDWLL